MRDGFMVCKRRTRSGLWLNLDDVVSPFKLQMQCWGNLQIAIRFNTSGEKRESELRQPPPFGYPFTLVGLKPEKSILWAFWANLLSKSSSITRETRAWDSFRGCHGKIALLIPSDRDEYKNLVYGKKGGWGVKSGLRYWKELIISPSFLDRV